MFCMGCGAHLSESDTFCTACGRPTGFAQSAPKRRSRAAIAVAVIVALLACSVFGVGGFFAWRRFAVSDPGTAAAPLKPVVFPPGPDLGKAEVRDPGPYAAIYTDRWGTVADGELGIIVADGSGRDVAEKAAASVGGTVTGEIAFIGLYQISLHADGEKALVAAAATLAKVPGVTSVLPDQPITFDTTLKGVRASVLRDDPVYSGANIRPYEMIGVEKAWDIVNAAGFEPNPVHVGVVDNGLYRKQGEFSGTTTFVTPRPTDELASRDTSRDPSYAITGSHGTAVAGIIGADPDNGGMAGVAGVLGRYMKVTVANRRAAVYEDTRTPKADPNDPTTAVYGAQGWTLGGLVAIAEQVKAGCSIINLSWGNSDVDPTTHDAYERFFTKMCSLHPGVLFVCSAGNDGKGLDGRKRIPSGMNLVNMITVGCLTNTGDRVDYSNYDGPDFRVEIGAPGDRVVAGVGPGGEVANTNGGTSYATPQVTAAAAILRALDPTLRATDIKSVLWATGTQSFTDPATGVETRVPFKDGCVAVDKAAFKVLTDVRARKNYRPLTMDDIDKLNTITLTGEGTPDTEWKVTAALPLVMPAGADVALTLTGQGAIGGTTIQNLKPGATALWSITSKDKGATVQVRRADTTARWRFKLATDDVAFAFTNVPQGWKVFKNPVNNGAQATIDSDDISGSVAAFQKKGNGYPPYEKDKATFLADKAKVEAGQSPQDFLGSKDSMVRDSGSATIDGREALFWSEQFVRTPEGAGSPELTYRANYLVDMGASGVLIEVRLVSTELRAGDAAAAERFRQLQDQAGALLAGLSLTGGSAK